MAEGKTGRGGAGAWYEQACRDFAATLRSKAAVLEAQYGALCEQPGDPVVRARLHDVFHRIRGSAGSYRRADLTRLAAQGEAAVAAIDRAAGADRAALAAIGAIIARFRIAAGGEDQS